MEEKYIIPASPEYSGDIRKLQDSDPASASVVFNPLIQRLIENIHYVYLMQKAERRHVIATRVRDPARPAYGLEPGGGGEAEVLLAVGPYTGTAEVSAVVSGAEYDAQNMRVGEDVPNGTLILTKLEE